MKKNCEKNKQASLAFDLPTNCNNSSMLTKQESTSHNVVQFSIKKSSEFRNRIIKDLIHNRVIVE